MIVVDSHSINKEGYKEISNLVENACNKSVVELRLNPKLCNYLVFSCWGGVVLPLCVEDRLRAYVTKL